MSSSAVWRRTRPETAREFHLRDSTVFVLPDAHERVSGARVGYVERHGPSGVSVEKIAVAPGTVAALDDAALWSGYVDRSRTAGWVRDAARASAGP